MKPARAPARFGVTRVDVRGFRSAREVAFLPGPVCALVGEANAGKSNLRAAIRAVLDPTTSPLTATDLAEDGDGEISINVRLADGSETKLQGSPERNTLTGGANAPPTLFLPAEERAGADSARKPSGKGRATGIFEQAFARETPSPAGTALAVLEAVECCRSEGLAGLLLLIEEPELYLRPRRSGISPASCASSRSGGNQVIYSTHSPALLNVTRLDELVFVEHLADTGTRTLQPDPVRPTRTSA